MQSPADNTPAQRPYDDEIDLFELFYSLWKQKLLIISVTLITAVIGTVFAFLQTPTYTLSASIGATNNLSASIQLTRLWNENVTEQTRFTTPVIAQYAPEETPYSPTGLYLRFAESLGSQDLKKRFITVHSDLPNAKLVNRLRINFPKRIDTQIPLALSLTTKDRSQVVNVSEAINTYLDWAKMEFGKKIQTEAYMLGSSENPVDVSDLPLVSVDKYASVPGGPVKPKKKLIIALAIVLGGMAGMTIALVRMTIRNRRPSQSA